MAEEPANLVFDLLRAMHGGMADIRPSLREHGHRLSRIEIGIAGLRRDQAQDAEPVAHVEVNLDHSQGRMARIEARLDIQSV